MPNIEITIKTIVDKAIADLKKTAGAVDGVDNSAKKTSGGVTDFAGAMLGLNQALELGQKIIAGAKMAYDATVGTFINYAAQVRDMSRATGESAEESSRMIQMADDMGISYDKLKTSLQMAARQGIDTSTESLKKLSEEYLTLAPGTERMQFLLETFGRSGADMGKLLEQGAEGIDAINASIEGGLILTEEILKQARAHEILKDMIDDEIASKKILAGLTATEIIDTAGVGALMLLRAGNLAELDRAQNGANLSNLDAITYAVAHRDALADQIRAEQDLIMAKAEEVTATEDLVNVQDDLALSNKDVVTNMQALNTTMPLAVINLESVRAKASELNIELQKLKDFKVIDIKVNYQTVVTGDTPPGNP